MSTKGPSSERVANDLDRIVAAGTRTDVTFKASSAAAMANEVRSPCTAGILETGTSF